ncbi:MAG: putative toxin-antitoxin system toxin component, PIN family [Betaproteobacteria bacterium]|nr:putative toxin-antitoxin system toxin component, PIN family [Betaproteobacteria bacterium]
MRIVADTNVVVSALLWGGKPGEILAACRAGEVTLHTSAVLVAELEEILGRAKFADRIARAGSSVEEFVADYLSLVAMVHAPALPQPVARDADDDHVLAYALAARDGRSASRRSRRKFRRPAGRRSR